MYIFLFYETVEITLKKFDFLLKFNFSKKELLKQIIFLLNEFWRCDVFQSLKNNNESYSKCVVK